MRVAPAPSATTTTASTSSPVTSMISTSFRPPSTALFTVARRPTNRRQSRAVLSGRSIPGDDTCNSYRSPSNAACSGASNHSSSPRDARAQSSTVTFSPSRRSIRTSTMGRDRLPPRRTSTRSYPSSSSRDSTTTSSSDFTTHENKKMWGTSPTFTSPSNVTAPHSRARAIAPSSYGSENATSAFASPNTSPPPAATATYCFPSLPR